MRGEEAMRRKTTIWGVIALLFAASTVSPQTIYLGAGVLGISV